jgi:hypothetical protein
MKILLFSVDIVTHAPVLDQIGIFPNMDEALKAKEFLKDSGTFGIVLPIETYESSEEFCDSWKERIKKQMLDSILK